LQGHIARANPQAADLDGGGRGAGDLRRAARLYLAELVRSRPGRADLELRLGARLRPARAIRDPEWLRDMVDRLSDPARGARGRAVADARPAEAYLESMLRGIVGIEIAVSRLEGKFKLSQNRPAARPAAHHRRARGVGAGQHRHGLAPAEAGASKGGERPVAIRRRLRVAPERPEPPAPGEGAGGGEIGVGPVLAKRTQRVRPLLGADTLGGEPGGDPTQRLAARQPRRARLAA
jgi:hypothetical protein